MISSSGEAARRWGTFLGQYEYHEDKGYYVQTSTEQSDENFEAVYLYPDEYDEWWVNHTPGQNAGWLHNPRSSQTPPSSGWRYADDGFPSDLTLTVIPGPLPPLPRQFTVTVTGAAAENYPSYQGVYTRTERWWYGRPVYVNTEGVFLYHGPKDNGWTMSDTLGIRVLWGSLARISPANENNWTYWNESDYISASITIIDGGQAGENIIR